jgi:hypothetical protein
MIEHADGFAPDWLVDSFGVVSIDWSNDKLNWAKAKPMDSQQQMYNQALRIKKRSPSTKVFIYKNLVKVRKKTLLIFFLLCLILFLFFPFSFSFLLLFIYKK